MDFLISLGREMFSFYNEIAIYLLLGLGVAGVLFVFFPESLIRRHLGRNSMGSVIKSTAIGIPLPLCSCGVVPVAAAMRKSGASKGATLSFLISTPQIGADSFLITYSLLGGIFAFFRIAAAFLTSLLVGLVTNLLEKGSAVPLPAAVAATTRWDHETATQRFKRLPGHVLLNILGPIANSLLAGIVIAGLIALFVPASVFETTLNNPLLSMILMMAIGIPMYVCASASTPIAASLIMKGMSPGAGLVFLLTGPATNAVTIATVAKTLGKRTAAIYLLGIALVSLMLGLALDITAAHYGLREMLHNHEHHDPLPAWLKLTGSGILTAMLIGYYFKTKVWDRHVQTQGVVVGKTTLRVTGMTCAHCASNVKKAVASVPGTHDILVDAGANKVEFVIENPEHTAKVITAIADSGYDVHTT